MRRIQIIGLAACLFLPAVANALGLGNLEQKSALNEPFNASIPLLKATADEIDGLVVKLANPEQFRRAGVDRGGALLRLRFEVVQSDKGGDYIRVTSHDPIAEPFLNFLIEASWARGRLVREYTALLDPPLYVPGQRLASRSASTSAPAAGVASSTATGEAWRSTEQEVRGGGVRTARPTGASETLWSAAERMRPDPSVSVQQMMIALWKANPEAFVQNNINGLKRGAILKMPDADAITAATKAEALAEASRHHALWEEFRGRGISAVPLQPQGAPSETATVSQTTTQDAGTPASAVSAAEEEARLKLLSAKESGDKAVTSEELALAREGVASRDREITELRSQLTESEQLIDSLKRMIVLKDEQLADLQDKLAATGGAESAPVAAQPAPAPEMPTPTETAAVEQAAAPAPPPEPAVEAKPEVEKEAAPAKTAAEQPAGKPETKPEEKKKAPARPAPEKKPAAGGMQVVLDQATNMISGIVPKSLLDTIPGGVLTLLGAVLVVVLGLIGGIVKVVRGRGEGAPMRKSVTRAKAEDEAEAEAETQFEEPITETREDTTQAAGGFAASDTTQIAAPPSGEGATGAEDPLAEVNVYLAYERFGEAEKIVKDVIARYPDEQKYKLRLLEVYYSANNKPAYEAAARALHDAVDGSGPLWDNAVAMWREMSPSRELFAEGADEATVVAEGGPAREFLDLTAGESQPADGMSDTVTMKPGAMAAASAGGEMDFDLGTGGGDVLDLTAAEPGAPAPALDFTMGEGGGEMLDITSGRAEATADDLLDISAPGGVSAAPAGTDDLLDVTKTGDVSRMDHTDLLNVTSPGAVAGGGDQDLLDITGGSGAGTADDLENVIEFDLGGVESAAAAAEPADAGVVDVTAGAAPDEIEIEAPAASDDALEFDIGGLSLEPEAAPAADAGAGEIQLDTVEMPAAASEQDTYNVFSAGGIGEEGLKFELAADSGDRPDEAAISAEDDGLSLVDDPGLSLDDLSKSLEDTVSGLGKSTAAEPVSFEEPAPGAVETLEFGPGELNIEEEPEDQTVAMPRAPNDAGGGSDEVDTKLNLARAYMELGDSDGAKAILNEVIAEGTDAQREEAEKLLQQGG